MNQVTQTTLPRTMPMFKVIVTCIIFILITFIFQYFYGYGSRENHGVVFILTQTPLLNHKLLKYFRYLFKNQSYHCLIIGIIIIKPNILSYQILTYLSSFNIFSLLSLLYFIYMLHISKTANQIFMNNYYYYPP